MGLPEVIRSNIGSKAWGLEVATQMGFGSQTGLMGLRRKTASPVNSFGLVVCTALRKAEGPCNSVVRFSMLTTQGMKSFGHNQAD